MRPDLPHSRAMTIPEVLISMGILSLVLLGVYSLFSALGRWVVKGAIRYCQGTPLEVGMLSEGLVNYLVIDEELMDSVPAQETRRSVVQSLLDLCTRLGVECVASGVTESSQGHFLALHQASWACGSFISPPLELQAFVSRRRTTWRFR
jgi:hypothetical protein